MLKLQNVSIARAANTLLEQVSFDLYEKNIVGLVGGNGSGKSTLFAAINGLLEPAKGEISLRNGTRIISLAQEVPGLMQTALSYAIEGDTKLAKVYADLTHAETVQDYEAMMVCHNLLSEMNGYDAEARAAKILNGLGFTQEDLSKPIKSFSGGWRMRLNLARCLFAPSDLLLLDEPTNHLDMEAIFWLEDYLKHYQGGVLMVSHDRDFLDSTVTHIAHADNQRIKMYTGNYSSFEVQRAQAILLHNAQARKQQTRIDHLMSYVNRFRAAAPKARQAQSRLKALEKLEVMKPIYEASMFSFEFKEPDRMPNPMLTMSKVDLGYEGKALLSKINMTLAAGMRVGLLGVNGAGKSTLIKGLLGKLKPISGVVECSSGTKIGYFDQQQVDYLPLNYTPLELFQEMARGTGEKELIGYLGSFGFDRDKSMSPLSEFSGGEKSRVALAQIVWQKPNLLMMDEPTNHLDLEMRQALMYALQGYTGSLILVSHDRSLLRSLVDELYLIKDGKVSRFEGSVEDYQSQYQ